MGNKIKVLIADDNPAFTSILTEVISRQERIELVGICDDGQKCIEFLAVNSVDVVLLDMIMPKLDGMGVLEKTAYLNLGNKPSFIVLSSLKSEHMITKVCDLGAKYYMVKPFDMQLLCKRIIQVYEESHVQIRGTKGGSITKREGVDEKITSVFLMVGIPAHIKGFHYLREGVRLVMDEPTLINKITKELYPSIAAGFDTTPSKVERAIRHAIEVAWNRGKIENINHVFGYQIYGKNDKPTNGEFIALMVDRLTVGQFK